MVLFVAQAHKNVSSTNSEDSKWSQKFILLLSRAVTLILARQLDPSLQSTEAQIHFQILKMSRRISTKISTTYVYLSSFVYAIFMQIQLNILANEGQSNTKHTF